MFKLHLLLFYEFSKIGVFALGGGYAALPFLYFLQNKYNWFTVDELTNMIAVSNITPGPIGINMATYTGYTTAGITGSVVATTSIVLIPFILTIVITKLFTKFQNNKYVNNIFDGLRPAACALLASVGLKLLYQTTIPNNIDFRAIILFFLIFIPFLFLKKNPLLVIIAGALGGIIIKSI